MSRRPTKPAPVVVKRSADQRRKLPPELEAFARSGDEKLRIRRPRADRGFVRDPREGYTVAGVANRDARAVYDVRAEEMGALWSEGAADEEALGKLGQLFHDVLRLELWRARRLTSFAAFAEEVVGIAAGRAEALAEAAAVRNGQPATPLTERAIALWLRTEAGLYEGDERARARVRGSEGNWTLELSVELDAASPALAGAGARHLPLARERERDRAASESVRVAPGRERDRAASESVRAEQEREQEREQDRVVRGGGAAWAQHHDPDDLEPAAEPGALATALESNEADLEPGSASSPPSARLRDERSADSRPPERAGSDAGPPTSGGARLLTRKPRVEARESAPEQTNDARWERAERDSSRPPRDAGPYRGRGDEGRGGFAGDRPSAEYGTGRGRDPGERAGREHGEPRPRGDRAARPAQGEPSDGPRRGERPDRRPERQEPWPPQGERGGHRGDGSRFERPRFERPRSERDGADGGRRFERDSARDPRRFDRGGERFGKEAPGRFGKVEARAGGYKRNDVDTRAGGHKRNDVDTRAGGYKRNDADARAGGHKRNDVDARAGGHKRNDVDARGGGRRRNDEPASAGRFGKEAGRARRFGVEAPGGRERNDHDAGKSGREPFTRKHGKGKGFGPRQPLPDRSGPSAAHGAHKTKHGRDDDDE